MKLSFNYHQISTLSVLLMLDNREIFDLVVCFFNCLKYVVMTLLRKLYSTFDYSIILV